MNRFLTTFLDRLAERFTAILASVVSSRVESLRAEAQAEQQSQLEDLARKYEADGKNSIAKTLRERALQLSSSNLAGDGPDVMAAVNGETHLRIGTGGTTTDGRRNGLPDFSVPPKPDRKPRQRRAASHDTHPSDDRGVEA